MSSWKAFFNAMTLLLLLGIGLAAVLLYFQWRNPPQPGEAGLQQQHPQAADQQRKQSATPFSPVALNVYREITDRPLFVEGRLPPEKPEQTTKSTVVRQAPLKLRLEGVVITPKSRVAVIRDLSSNRLLRVSQGMNQDDWKLEALDTSSATVVRRGKKQRLELEIERNAKRAAPKIKLPFRPSKR